MYNLTANCSSLFLKKEHFRHILLYYFRERKKMLYKLIKNDLRCLVKELWNYDSVRIRLLNFTADKDLKSFLELSFVKRILWSWLKYIERSSNKMDLSKNHRTYCLIKFSFLVKTSSFIHTHKNTLTFWLT